MNINLSINEKKVIETFEKRFSKNAKFRITFEGLISNWQALVESLEAGYKHELDDYLYDYVNDLGNRELIEEILDSLPFKLKSKIKITLDSIDEKFKKATLEDTKGIILKGVREENHWWYARIPKNWASTNFMEEYSSG